MRMEKSAVSSPASAERSVHESSAGGAKVRPAAPKPPDLKSPRAGKSFSLSADILSLHLPLNKDTRGIVTRDDLARMKPTALLVNPSRAGLIAKDALADALRSGRPGMAAVDVYEEEPVIGADHPLVKMENVTCTPHLGYVTRESYEEYYAVVIEDILAFAAGKPNHVLNPEAIGKPKS